MPLEAPNAPLLSIVIPAYKSAYLAQTLESLRAQDCLNFEVVVADDASPADLKSLFDVHSQGLAARYCRFDANLGARALTAHWERAVAQAKGAWIMLLGDDDLLDPSVVSAFYRALEATAGNYDVYRFNTRQINAKGAVGRTNPKHPEWESAYDFLLARWRGERASYTCEYIFSRAAFDDNQGFVPFPLAWCSDDATWIALSARNGIYTIPHAMASWRLSGENITSQRPELAVRKLAAGVLFLNWAKRFFADRDAAAPGQAADHRAMSEAGICWFYRHLWKTRPPVGIGEGLSLALGLSEFSGRSMAGFMLKIVKHDFRCLLRALSGK
jgi:glycosyltransferase involved in cell wall biosynthesis